MGGRLTAGAAEEKSAAGGKADAAASKPRAHRPVRTPTVLAMEIAECAAASLGMILAYHGKFVPLEVLREECGVSRDGGNAKLLHRAAEGHKLKGKPLAYTTEAVRKLPPPFIAFWRGKHFLIVEGFRGDRAYLNDPATGRRSVSASEFDQGFLMPKDFPDKKRRGLAYVYRPDEGFESGGRRPSAVRALTRRLRGTSWPLAMLALAGILLVIPNLLAALFGKVFVDEILIGEKIEWFRPLLIAMGATLILRVLLTALQQKHLARLEAALAASESAKFLWHVLRLPSTFFQRRYAGDIASRVAAHARMAKVLTGDLATTLVNLLTIVFYGAFMFRIDPLLAGLGVGLSSLNLLAVRASARGRVEDKQAIEQAQGKLASNVTWALQNIESVKAAGTEPDLMVRWTGFQARLVNAKQRLGLTTQLMQVVPPLVSVLIGALILGLGGHDVITGTLTIGGLVAFQTLIANFAQPFTSLVQLGTTLQDLETDVNRVEDVTSYRFDPVFHGSPGPGQATGTIEAAAPEAVPPPGGLRRLSGHVEFRNVTFGYNPMADPLLKDFSLMIRPGQRIALVGGSGSGKSTVGRLLAGLVQPWQGEILFDGLPRRSISLPTLLASIAVVDESVFLYAGTVRENLSLWDETLSDEALVRAAIDAHIHGDLIRRPGGYGSRLSEGARNLSGGQRQRLEIARALTRSPSILVLDEATSALDPKSEELVDDDLRRRGCTCLIIAHRLSTIRDADEILVLRRGEVVERGRHEDLIARPDGAYARLLRDQGTSAPEPAPAVRSRRSVTGASLEWSHGQARAARPSRQAIAGRAPASVSEGDDVVEFEARLETFPEARRVACSGNHPLPLDDHYLMWRVLSGKVDIFFVQPDPEQLEGSRDHLCRVEEGGAIFGMEGLRGHAGAQLMAIGVGEAQLLQFHKGDLIRLSIEDDRFAPDIAALIDGWVETLGRGLAPSEPVGRSLRIRDDEPTCRLEAGRVVLGRNSVVWVRPARGEPEPPGMSLLAGEKRYIPALFLGKVPIEDPPDEAQFPLSTRLWMRAERPVSLLCYSTRHLLTRNDPWRGLRLFHQVVLDHASRARDERLRSALQQRIGASGRDESLMRQATSRLREALTRDVAPIRDAAGISPLLAVCRAVGQARGLTVRAPRVGSGAEIGLGDICRVSGIAARKVTLRPDWSEDCEEPMLGFLEAGDHPVAILPGPKGCEVWDPREPGRSRIATGADLPALSERAYVFYPTLPARGVGPGELARFALAGLGREIATVWALGGIVGLLLLVYPIGMGLLMSQVLPEADYPGLLLVAGGLAASGLTVALFRGLQGLLLLRIEGKVAPRLLPAVWNRMLNLPARFYTKFTAGDLAHRAFGIDAILKAFSGAAVSTLLASLFALVNLPLLFWYAWPLALVAMGLIAASAAVAGSIMFRQMEWNRRIRQAEGEVSGILLELLGGITKLRIAGAERRGFARWADAFRNQVALTLKARESYEWLSMFFAALPILNAMILYAAVMGLGVEAVTVGSFLAFNLAFVTLVTAGLNANATLVSLAGVIPTYERARPILEAPPECGDLAAEPVLLAGAISVDDVSFRYDEDGPAVLSKVNIQVRPGEFVAIVGPSGSGKSTLLRLLLGFETPAAGTVSFDGKSLATLDVRDVRRQIGVVLQTAQVMPGDIFTNIVGFSDTLTAADAWTAARKAGLAPDIEAFPMKMFTPVSEGAPTLSGGQRQRLFIARALVREPKILLLDEATSALDNPTQKHVMDEIARLNVTRVVIAHRLSTIQNADRIYVLKDGRVVEQGTYRQLMERGGLFREMAERQQA